MMEAVTVGDHVSLVYHDQSGKKAYQGVVSQTWVKGHQFQLEDGKFEIIDPRIQVKQQ
jgi:hypothetical protein